MFARGLMAGLGCTLPGPGGARRFGVGARRPWVVGACARRKRENSRGPPRQLSLVVLEYLRHIDPADRRVKRDHYGPGVVFPLRIPLHHVDLFSLHRLSLAILHDADPGPSSILPARTGH